MTIKDTLIWKKMKFAKWATIILTLVKFDFIDSYNHARPLANILQGDTSMAR